MNYSLQMKKTNMIGLLPVATGKTYVTECALGNITS